jgi:hypothetical protein
MHLVSLNSTFALFFFSSLVPLHFAFCFIVHLNNMYKMRPKIKWFIDLLVEQFGEHFILHVGIFHETGDIGVWFYTL